MLELAAAIGREFDYGLVLRAAGLVENVVLDALDELRAAGSDSSGAIVTTAITFVDTDINYQTNLSTVTRETVSR